MTQQSGQTDTGPGAARATEVAEYVAAVREALRDLPAAQRDDLLEDLPAHLAEVAAEDPTPLTERLGEPAVYAAELRAAVEPAAGGRRPTLPAWLRGQWDRVLGRLRRLDVRIGPLIGYARASEFGRLLVPAWWVLRGYLAAMVVVAVLDQSGNVGLLPRLGGSTIAGLAILAVAVAGSIWLAHREPRLTRWPRRTVYAGSGLLVLLGLTGFISIDSDQQGSPGTGPTRYVSGNPYDQVEDVYVVGPDGQLVTDARLFDQAGRPIDLGYAWCDREFPVDSQGRLVVTYPRCPTNSPWWPPTRPATPTPTPTGTPAPSATPSPAPSATPSVTPSATPSPSASGG